MTDKTDDQRPAGRAGGRGPSRGGAGGRPPHGKGSGKGPARGPGKAPPRRDDGPAGERPAAKRPYGSKSGGFKSGGFKPGRPDAGGYGAGGAKRTGPARDGERGGQRNGRTFDRPGSERRFDDRRPDDRRPDDRRPDNRRSDDRRRDDRFPDERPARAYGKGGGRGPGRPGGREFDKAPGRESKFAGRAAPPRTREGAAPRRAPSRLAPSKAVDEAQRIAKVMARAGVASRRDAEEMIAAGRVAVNGKVIDSPALDIGPSDIVSVDGRPLPARERTRLWLYHKPAGLVTTSADPEGRPTVFDRLPPDLPRVISVGRLDINTEGLLLLTNDGGLARVLAHPETGWLRRYRVRAFGEVGVDALDKLSEGITIDGIHYGPIQAVLQRQQGDNVWLLLGLREGKNREVKRILEHLGLHVNRLIRLSFGPFQLGDLGEGAVEEVSLRVLRDQLGEDLAHRAGVDFDAPVVERAAAPHGDATLRRRTDLPGRSDGPRPDRGPRGRDEAAGDPRDAGRETGRSILPGGRPTRQTWRDEEAEAAMPRGTRKPRRGDDPKAAREASATRERVRAGRIAAPGGRGVVVERLVSTPEPKAIRETGAPEAPHRDRGQRPGGGRFGDRDRTGGKPFGGGRAETGRFSGERRSRDAAPGDDRPPRRERPAGGRPFGDKKFGRRPSDGASSERSSFRRDGDARPPRKTAGEGGRKFGPARDRAPGGGRDFGGRDFGGRDFSGRDFSGRDSGERAGGPGRRPHGAMQRGSAPRGDAGGDAPRRGPPKGGFKGGFKGPFKGPPRGAPKGPRGPSKGPGGSGRR